MDREQIELDRVESQFPTKLRALRHEKNLSRRELAIKLTTDTLSFSVSAIAGYENGRFWPNLNKCLRLCEFFDVTIEYLFVNGKREKFGAITESSDDDELDKLAEYLYKTGDLAKMEEALRTGGKAKLEEYTLGLKARLVSDIKSGKFSLIE
ncbi:MAG: helix-turn-helix domain-containing protein [Oscillospiraceae bacterium]|nr:helix-turn-helix domain-containing protein [Oscillospiraceae bacterium]